MKMIKRIGVAALLATAILGAGCSSTNTQQIVNSSSGDGFLGSVMVPVTSSTSIGAKMFVGRFNTSTVIQPTSTNTIHAPSLAIAVAGVGKQSVSGSAGTNNAVGISDGSRDASILTTGAASVTGQNSTNVTLKVEGQ